MYAYATMIELRQIGRLRDTKNPVRVRLEVDPRQKAYPPILFEVSSQSYRVFLYENDARALARTLRALAEKQVLRPHRVVPLFRENYVVPFWESGRQGLRRESEALSFTSSTDDEGVHVVRMTFERRGGFFSFRTDEAVALAELLDAAAGEAASHPHQDEKLKRAQRRP